MIKTEEDGGDTVKIHLLIKTYREEELINIENPVVVEDCSQ